MQILTKKQDWRSGDRLSEIAVLEYIKYPLTCHGMSIDEIKKHFISCMTEDEINTAIHSLLLKENIYSTIDNQHFKHRLA